MRNSRLLQLAAVAVLTLGVATATTSAADAAPQDNAPDCESYATLSHHLDPAHNYVCINKANDIWGYDSCVNQGNAWHPVKFWCTHDPWPTYDLDGVVITR